jgi:hypothetical protein
MQKERCSTNCEYVMSRDTYNRCIRCGNKPAVSDHVNVKDNENEPIVSNWMQGTNDF